MGRSVAVPINVTQVVYMDIRDYDDDHNYDMFIDDLRSILKKRFKSFQDARRWDGREGLAILENDLASVVLCEYCGVASVSLVPEENSLAENWARQAKFKETLIKYFPDYVLRRVATFSNGESMYERINK